MKSQKWTINNLVNRKRTYKRRKLRLLGENNSLRNHFHLMKILLIHKPRGKSIHKLALTTLQYLGMMGLTNRRRTHKTQLSQKLTQHSRTKLQLLKISRPISSISTILGLRPTSCKIKDWQTSKATVYLA